MMRSLYSAITGLKNNQTSMDVIGNNIANVNTAGYKRERASFATMLGQEIRGSSAPDSDDPTLVTTGGTNGITIGLGSILGSVDKLMTTGSSQYTGKSTDMMINGPGMFVVSLGGETFYTRTGNFDLDRDGNLVDNSTGALVQGYVNSTADNGAPVWPADLTDPASLGPIQFNVGTDNITVGTDTYTLSSYSIGKDGVITGVYTNDTGTVSRQMYQIAVAGFTNPAGLNYEGNNYYTESNNSGDALLGVAGDAGKGSIMTGNLEMSNVDLAQEFTDMIVAQRGFQANSRVITVSDTLLQELIDLKRS